MRCLLLPILSFGGSAVAQVGFGDQQGRVVYRPGEDVTGPAATYKQEAKYSAEALKARLQGSVLLEAVVDETGKPISAKVLRPLQPMALGLNERAIAAAIGWKFAPGMKDGGAVAVATQIEIPFRLPDAPAAK